MEKNLTTNVLFSFFAKFVAALFAGWFVMAINNELFSQTVLSQALPALFAIGYVGYVLLLAAKTQKESSHRELGVVKATLLQINALHKESQALAKELEAQSQAQTKQIAEQQAQVFALEKALREIHQDLEGEKQIATKNYEIAMQQKQVIADLEAKLEHQAKIAGAKFIELYEKGRQDEKELATLVRAIPQVKDEEKKERMTERMETLAKFWVGKEGEDA